MGAFGVKKLVTEGSVPCIGIEHWGFDSIRQTATFLKHRMSGMRGA
jgi:hypothetical protein